jgi:hypothetical protein
LYFSSLQNSPLVRGFGPVYAYSRQVRVVLNNLKELMQLYVEMINIRRNILCFLNSGSASPPIAQLVERAAVIVSELCTARSPARIRLGGHIFVLHSHATSQEALFPSEAPEWYPDGGFFFVRLVNQSHGPTPSFSGKTGAR